MLLSLFAYTNLLINHANQAHTTHHTSIREHATHNQSFNTHIAWKQEEEKEEILYIFIVSTP